MSDKLDNLNKWLNVDTWHTGHPSDDERFYKAVHSVLMSNREKRINADDVRDFIIERYRGKLEDGFLFEEAQNAALRFETIQEYCFTNKLL